MSAQNEQALADKPDQQVSVQEGKQPFFSPSSRKGDLGLTLFAIVWAIAVIAVGLLMQG